MLALLTSMLVLSRPLGVNHVTVGGALLVLVTIRIIVCFFRTSPAKVSRDKHTSPDSPESASRRTRLTVWLDHSCRLTGLLLIASTIYTASAGILLQSGRVNDAAMSWLMVNANNYTLNSVEKLHNLSAMVTASLLVIYLAAVPLSWVIGQQLRQSFDSHWEQVIELVATQRILMSWATTITIDKERSACRLRRVTCTYKNFLSYRKLLITFNCKRNMHTVTDENRPKRTAWSAPKVRAARVSTVQGARQDRRNCRCILSNHKKRG